MTAAPGNENTSLRVSVDDESVPATAAALPPPGISMASDAAFVPQLCASPSNWGKLSSLVFAVPITPLLLAAMPTPALRLPLHFLPPATTLVCLCALNADSMMLVQALGRAFDCVPTAVSGPDENAPDGFPSTVSDAEVAYRCSLRPARPPPLAPPGHQPTALPVAVGQLGRAAPPSDRPGLPQGRSQMREIDPDHSGWARRRFSSSCAVRIVSGSSHLVGAPTRSHSCSS